MHKGEETGIVAINEQNREILFAECKWSEKLDAARVLKDLKEKASQFLRNRRSPSSKF